VEETELDKSEEATPFKLKRAREKGSVARSLDLGFFASVSAALGFLWIGGTGFAFAIAQVSGKAFAAAPSLVNGESALLAVIGQLFSPLLFPLMAFAGSLFAIALVLDFLQVGPVFSATPLKPDFNRLNPAQGLKRIFSWRMAIEAFKALFKLAVYSAIAWLVIGSAIDAGGQAISDGARLGGVIFSASLKLIMFCAFAALGFAALDQIFVRREFAKKMRMSRRELKREYRDREGEPRMKQARKQLHAEFSKIAKSLRDVKGADIIITNPEHYAVALRYDADRMTAPKIVSRGAGGMAQRIKRIGFTFGVVTVREPLLARQLFFKGQLATEIPDSFYQPVADLYLRHNIKARVAA
jgi:flagellar biosynthesis protein FlhB